MWILIEVFSALSIIQYNLDFRLSDLSRFSDFPTLLVSDLLNFRLLIDFLCFCRLNVDLKLLFVWILYFCASQSFCPNVFFSCNADCLPSYGTNRQVWDLWRSQSISKLCNKGPKIVFIISNLAKKRSNIFKLLKKMSSNHKTAVDSVVEPSIYIQGVD